MSTSIWCIGKNYSLHAKELSEPLETEPLVFLKSSHCLVPSGEIIDLPRFSSNIEYEVELAFLFDDALEFSHITIALDLTARDIQSACKEKGLPWTLAKSFKKSCPLGLWHPYKKSGAIDFSLMVNGTLRQKGNSSAMLFSLDDIKKYLKERFPVRPGDMVLTGTPEGISKVLPGDRASVYLENTLMGSWSFS
ncbi:MAG: fumarylacetoacetate hydrolase family protein [Chlamydiae bacterium]|nr:fumarylacetoacetate hydrolase family protein [Chlamydiota bacterium]